MVYEGKELAVKPRELCCYDEGRIYAAAVCWGDKMVLSVPEYLINNQDVINDAKFFEFDIDVISNDNKPYREFGVYFRSKFVASFSELLLKEVSYDGKRKA